MLKLLSKILERKLAVYKVNHVIIVANGQMSDYKRFKEYLEGADLIIAADGGLKHLSQMDIAPTLMLGDFDSIDSIGEYRKQFPKAKTISFEERKNYTDSEIAVRKAIAYQPDRITLLAVTGNRLDHTLVNVTLLKLIYDAGIQGVIINEDNEIRYTESPIVLTGDVGSNMSLVPVSDVVTGITLKGFEYPLDNAKLYYGSTLGISNVFAKEEGSIHFRNGQLLILQSRD